MFWRQIERATYELRRQEQLSLWVGPSDGHNDYLMSLALCCRAAQESLAPAIEGMVPLVRGSVGRWAVGTARVMRGSRSSYPMRDTLLLAAEEDLYRPAWSEAIGGDVVRRRRILGI